MAYHSLFKNDKIDTMNQIEYEEKSKMQFIQTKAKIKNGQLIIEQPHQNLPTDTEIEVVIIVSDENKQVEFEQARTKMQAAFKEAGIETDEQILELIREVKQELLQERYE
jgi:type IV secretory pathway VirJ component